MFQQIKGIAILAVIGVVGYVFFFADGGEQTADLGQVLDRTEYAVVTYQDHMTGNNIAEFGDEQMKEFTEFYVQVLNADPKFYDQKIGLNIQEDATFLGFVDANGDNVQDSGDNKLFTVEIDEANQRLIATDLSGESSGLRFSGAGFIAGALIGSMLSRQRGAGITANSFNNRNVTPRSNYKAPSSARSGGPRAGK